MKSSHCLEDKRHLKLLFVRVGSHGQVNSVRLVVLSKSALKQRFIMHACLFCAFELNKLLSGNSGDEKNPELHILVIVPE